MAELRHPGLLTNNSRYTTAHVYTRHNSILKHKLTRTTNNISKIQHEQKRTQTQQQEQRVHVNLTHSTLVYFTRVVFALQTSTKIIRNDYFICVFFPERYSRVSSLKS